MTSFNKLIAELLVTLVEIGVLPRLSYLCRLSNSCRNMKLVPPVPGLFPEACIQLNVAII